MGAGFEEAFDFASGAVGLFSFTYEKAVNEGLLTGKLAWRQDDGGHTDAPNMKYFIQWADKFNGYSK